MLDFLGFIATAALMVLAVNAVITFMDVSPSAKLTRATLAGLWIGVAAAAGSGQGAMLWPSCTSFIASPNKKGPRKAELIRLMRLWLEQRGRG
jgi:hypothetical protein